MNRRVLMLAEVVSTAVFTGTSILCCAAPRGVGPPPPAQVDTVSPPASATLHRCTAGKLQDAPVVSLAGLSNSPEQYLDVRVRVQGFFLNSYEMESLTSGTKEGPWVHIRYGKLDIRHCQFGDVVAVGTLRKASQHAKFPYVFFVESMRSAHSAPDAKRSDGGASASKDGETVQ
jgi:hypothetical protein